MDVTTIPKSTIRIALDRNEVCKIKGCDFAEHVFAKVQRGEDFEYHIKKRDKKSLFRALNSVMAQHASLHHDPNKTTDNTTFFLLIVDKKIAKKYVRWTSWHAAGRGALISMSGGLLGGIVLGLGIFIIYGPFALPAVAIALVGGFAAIVLAGAVNEASITHDTYNTILENALKRDVRDKFRLIFTTGEDGGWVIRGDSSPFDLRSYIDANPEL